MKNLSKLFATCIFLFCCTNIFSQLKHSDYVYEEETRYSEVYTSPINGVIYEIDTIKKFDGGDLKGSAMEWLCECALTEELKSREPKYYHALKSYCDAINQRGVSASVYAVCDTLSVLDIPDSIPYGGSTIPVKQGVLFDDYENGHWMYNYGRYDTELYSHKDWRIGDKTLKSNIRQIKIPKNVNFSLFNRVNKLCDSVEHITVNTDNKVYKVYDNVLHSIRILGHFIERNGIHPYILIDPFSRHAWGNLVHYEYSIPVLYGIDYPDLVYYPALKEDSVYYVREGVEVIRRDAFKNNKFIRKIVLPTSIREICCDFSGCVNLREIEFRGKPWSENRHQIITNEIAQNYRYVYPLTDRIRFMRIIKRNKYLIYMREPFMPIAITVPNGCKQKYDDVLLYIGNCYYKNYRIACQHDPDKINIRESDVVYPDTLGRSVYMDRVNKINESHQYAPFWHDETFVKNKRTNRLEVKINDNLVMKAYKWVLKHREDIR